jgi:hypothetical protein
MLDASTFLTELAESRRREQAATRADFELPQGLELPRALEISLAHHLYIQPTLALSPLAGHSARIGVPSCEREQIEFWYARYGDEANWLLDLGESGIAAVEIELPLAWHSLLLLTRNDDSWRRSLQFIAYGKRQILYRCTGGRPFIDNRYHGLRLHASGSILIPPSYSRRHGGLQFKNESRLFPTPEWLCQTDNRA